MVSTARPAKTTTLNDGGPLWSPDLDYKEGEFATLIYGIDDIRIFKALLGDAETPNTGNHPCHHERGDVFWVEYVNQEKQFLDSEGFTINLFTYKIKVNLSPDDGKNALGIAKSAKQEMWLDSTAGKDVRTSTFFHECVHMIDHTFGIGLSETQTDCMAMGITSLIKDNPDFIRSLLKKGD
ncbi:MAG: hypothetical protein V3V61_00250 [Gammaproteobacteria bacterium]